MTGRRTYRKAGMGGKGSDGGHLLHSMETHSSLCAAHEGRRVSYSGWKVSRGRSLRFQSSLRRERQMLVCVTLSLSAHLDQQQEVLFL